MLSMIFLEWHFTIAVPSRSRFEVGITLVPLIHQIADEVGEVISTIPQTAWTCVSYEIPSP